MAQQTINVGTAPNDGTGDKIRDGAIKINANFDEIYPLLPTQDEKNALPGPSGHPPQTSNPYVTLSYLDTLGLDRLPTADEKDALVSITGHSPSSLNPFVTESYLDTLGLERLPTANEKAALVSISGHGPTVSNPFATKSYVDLAISNVALEDGDRGDITVSSSGSVWTIDNGAITTSKINDGSVTTAKIPDSAITNAKISSVAWSKVTGVPTFSGSTVGLVPDATSAGANDFLRSDGTWVNPSSLFVVTASNGLSASGNNVKLGGTDITENTTLNLTGGSDFVISSAIDNMAAGFGVNTFNGFHIASGDYVARTGAYSDFNVSSSYMLFTTEGSDDHGVEFRVGRGTSTTGTYFYDNRTVKEGIRYLDVGYETTSLSLITRGWAEGQFASRSIFNSGDDGLTPASGGGTTNFLRADGTWAAPPSGGTITIGTFDSILPRHDDGAQMSGSTIVFQSANTSAPGMVSTGSQTFAGNKTFNHDFRLNAAFTAAGLTQDDTKSQVLVKDSTTHKIYWRAASTIGGSGGITNVGTIDSQTKSDNGGVISGSLLYFQTADATKPGLVSTGTQSFAGEKTFDGIVNLHGGVFIPFAAQDDTSGKVLALNSLDEVVWRDASTIGGGGGISDGDKGDITVSGSGTTWTIDNDVVTYAKMQNVSINNRFLGRISSGAGNVQELTGTQATSLLDVFTSSAKGLVPASGGGTTNFLRADGTWAAPGGGGGGVTTVGVMDSQSKSNNGGVISGTSIYFQTADENDPGLVSDTTQVFGGNKTFRGTVNVNNNFGVWDIEINPSTGSILAGNNAGTIYTKMDSVAVVNQGASTFTLRAETGDVSIMPAASHLIKLGGLGRALPTSDPGVSFALWNDGGVVKISAG